MAESKTARQSMQAGMNREGKKDPFDTPEKKIAELRKQRTDKLFVNRMDFVDALLAEYDKERAAVVHLATSTSNLLKRAETAEEQHRAAQTINVSLISQLQEAENNLKLAVASSGATTAELEEKPFEAPADIRMNAAIKECREAGVFETPTNPEDLPF